MQAYNRCSILRGGFVLTCVLSHVASAATPDNKASALVPVRAVLLSETASDAATIDRRAKLQPATIAESASNEAWWQSGFVRIGNSWLEAEKSADEAGIAIMDQYRIQRAATPRTVDGQLKLANWCERNQLKEQERAHLMQVLILSDAAADRTPTYRRLGYRLIGEHWVSPSEVEEWKRVSQRQAVQLREWTPTLERIARNWAGNVKQRKLAEEELGRIESPAAIPAMLAASTLDESLDLAICQRLSKMSSFEASQALATLALHSSRERVRSAATEELKGRRIDDFAPALLFALHGPLTFVKSNTGSTEPRLIFREDADQFVALDVELIPGGQLEIVFHDQRLRWTRPSVRRFTTVAGAVSLVRAGIDEARNIDAIDHEIQSRSDDENDRAEEINRRSATVLAAVTGQELSLNPQYWWNWWARYTGTSPRPKRVKILSRRIQLPPQIVASFATAHSCLIAGTPISTDCGLLPVDQIQVGDRVLAKDISTGEVCYKPVVHTTVREPVPVKKFVVAGSPIVASDGHHFWSSGSGWTKTRDIQENLPIHTVTGMSRVESIESQPKPEPVYNLVVADFHTYFVGPGMVLSHDVTPPAPTNVKVPGLTAEEK